MAEVSGTLGDQPIELNNAATEATLKLLLVAMKASSKEAAAAVDKIVKQAGIDPATVKNANEANEKSASVAYKVGAVFGSLANKTDQVIDAFNKYSPIVKTLTSGGTNVGQAMNQLGALIPGVGGKVVQALGQVALIQEEYLAAYQSMTKAGINFGGSLTDMRMAASNTYMTLAEFGNLMKTNSGTFARLGGTAEQGAKAFVGLSNSLLKSDAGDSLRALGYTSVEVNEGLAGYLAVTGGRNKQELQNTAAITKGAAEYLTQLDALATISGVQKEEQKKAMDEAKANQAYQAYLLTLDEEGKKKANAAMLEANAKGGKGAMDALTSQLLGLPPMTKAAQEFTALAPAASNSITKMASNVADSTKSVADQQKEGARLGVAVGQDVARIGKDTSNALIMGGGALAGTIGQMQGTANQLKTQGIKTNADAEKQLNDVVASQKKRKESEAADAAEAGKALQEMGQVLMRVLMPVFKLLAWTVNFVVDAISVPFRLLGSIIDKTIELFKPLMPSLIKFGEAFGSVLTPIMDVLKAFGGAVLDVMDLAFTPLKITFGVLLKALEVSIDVISWSLGILGKGLRMLADVVVGVWTGISKVVEAIKSFLPSWAGGGDSKKPEGKAGGGPIGANKQYLVGEKGPELFTSGTSGQIIPNHLLGLPPMTNTAQAFPGTGGGGMMDKLLPAIKDMAKLTPLGMAANAVGSLMGDKSEGQNAASMPDKHLESLSIEMKLLNTRVIELLKHTRDTADYARQNVDATKDLNGNLFS